MEEGCQHRPRRDFGPVYGGSRRRSGKANRPIPGNSVVIVLKYTHQDYRDLGSSSKFESTQEVAKKALANKSKVCFDSNFISVDA